jgi:hypothetical protein
VETDSALQLEELQKFLLVVVEQEQTKPTHNVD